MVAHEEHGCIAQCIPEQLKGYRLVNLRCRKHGHIGRFVQSDVLNSNYYQNTNREIEQAWDRHLERVADIAATAHLYQFHNQSDYRVERLYEKIAELASGLTPEHLARVRSLLGEPEQPPKPAEKPNPYGRKFG